MRGKDTARAGYRRSRVAHFSGGRSICAITDDIYIKEDALILTRAGALPVERILGVKNGGL
jgi:Ni2+-binding GTPase involved in maturation of urease and hydrogenase